MKRPIVTLIAVALLSGCATPLPPQPETTKTFTQPFDKVWSVVVAEVSAGYPLKVIEKVSGIIETDLVNISGTPDRYCQHPSVLLGIWEAGRMKTSVFVKTNDGGATFVRIRSHFERFESNMSKTWYVCPSNGAMETKLMEPISRQL